MEKAAWCTVTPTSGRENGTINISAAAHTGRAARSTIVVVTAVNGTKPAVDIAVSQMAAAVSTTMESTKPDATPNVETITINGTSNSSKLKWRLTALMFDAEINLEPIVDIAVKVDGVLVGNETAIAGDPGAIGMYNFTATLTISAMKWAIDSPVTFTVTDDAGANKACVFIRKASASSLSVDKSSLSLVNAGAAQAVNVTSNDDWTVA